MGGANAVEPCLFAYSRAIAKLSLGELLCISQRERQVSRKYHLRIIRDPFSPLKNVERRAKRRAGYYSPPMMFARFLGRLFR